MAQIKGCDVAPDARQSLQAQAPRAKETRPF